MATFGFSNLDDLFLDQLTEGTCPTGKKRYPAGKAPVALELARLRLDIEPWRRERRSYFCSICRGVHLTKEELGFAA